MRALLSLVPFLVLACNGGGDGSPIDGGNGIGCPNPLDPISRECDLAFAPTYDAFYDNLLGPTCGASSTGSSCHGPMGGMAGLYLHDREMAYAYLLGEEDGRARVIPGDPECSHLVERIESDDPEVVMPPGDPLSTEERCSIVRWIDMGAER